MTIVILKPNKDSSLINRNSWSQFGATNTTKYSAVLTNNLDSDYIFQTVSNKIQLFELENGNIPTQNCIDSVIIYTVHREEPFTIPPRERIRTVYNFKPLNIEKYSLTYAPIGSYQIFSFDITNDRNWIPENFDNNKLEIGVETRGTITNQIRVTQIYLEISYHPWQIGAGLTFGKNQKQEGFFGPKEPC